MVPNLAPQTRVAFSSIFWKTGSNSPGEALMTWRTSDVAVCCSSDSASSRERACTSSNSRAFSMAITAWFAKVVARSTCLLLKGCTLLREMSSRPVTTPSRMRGTPNMLRMPAARWNERKVYSGSLSVSSMSTGAFARSTRAPSEPRPGS